MPLYGSVAAAKTMLRADGVSTFSADQDARLTALQKAVSLYIEQATGRTFGTGTTSETVVANGKGRSLLLLPRAARSVTSVVANPDWSGTAWIGGSPLLATEYRIALTGELGEGSALELIDGGTWHGRFLVTGTFETTDADTTIPDDITYCANYLVAERFKLENASPAGQIGPDGSVIPVRDALRDPLVRAAIDKYAIVARQVV
jgi:hypothetical protein